MGSLLPHPKKLVVRRNNALLNQVKNKSSKIDREITLKKALLNGNAATRSSCLIMGMGNFLHTQIVKGFLFLGIEVAFILYMIFRGGQYLQGLVSLGTQTTGKEFDEVKQIYVYTQGDNSMLYLLYGIFTLFVILFFIFAWASAVKSAYLAQVTEESGKKPNSIVEDVKALFDGNIHKLLLSMPIVCIIAFTILPLVFMICMAFTNYDRDHQPPGQLFDWVGLANFKEIFSSGSGIGYAFRHVLAWTLVWAVAATLLNYIFGLILAMIINRKETRYKKFWRSTFILSIAIPQFVSLLVMRTMLQPEGAVNVLLKNLGLISKSLPFWTNVTWARITIIVVNLWIGIPYTMLQTTGILQNIPAELYESAKVDGANAFVTFWKITLPYMLFVTTPYLITSFIGNINNFNVIYLLTAGAPASLSYDNGTAGKTDLLVTWLYNLTIKFNDYNYGAVIGILVFILSAVFALTTYRRTGSYNKEEEFQ